MRLRGAQGHLLKCKLQGPALQALIQEIQTTWMQEMEGPHSGESGLPGPSRGGVSAPAGPEARGPSAWGEKRGG